jgi:hypothetical protein
MEVRMERNVIIVVVVIVALAFGALIWWKRSDAPEPVTAPLPAQQSSPTAEQQPRTPEPAPEVDAGVDEAPLPPLDDADSTVRSEVLAASGAAATNGDSTLATWLGQDDLIRRFAVLANNAAKGEYPWRQLGFLAPTERMPVIVDDDGRIQVDPKGYARFDRFVDTVTSVPPSAAASLVKRYSPLIAEALGELGEGETDALATVRAGIDEALATPVIEGPIELTQPKVFYQYADPEVENLPPLQKQLLRMGPENVKQLQAYLTEVKALL